MNKSYTMCIHSKISVVIPTYHRRVELSELFDSILRQTINPFEVIVVDDTPNDNIQIVCEEYKSKFEKINTELKYIKNPRQRSAAIARNVGVENASGDIILFLDSDTILYQDYIEKILEVFDTNSNALGVQGWIISNIIEYNKTTYFIFLLLAKIFYLGHYSKNSCRFTEYPTILTKIINCEWMSGNNMALKRKVLNEFRFDENLLKFSVYEDRLLSHSIFQKYPNSLFITPYARSIHKHSETGRMEEKELEKHTNWCIKYCLKKLFGFKGILLYYWQHIGKSIVRICKRFL